MARLISMKNVTQSWTRLGEFSVLKNQSLHTCMIRVRVYGHTDYTKRSLALKKTFTAVKDIKLFNYNLIQSQSHTVFDPVCCSRKIILQQQEM